MRQDFLFAWPTAPAYNQPNGHVLSSPDTASERIEWRVSEMRL